MSRNILGLIFDSLILNPLLMANSLRWWSENTSERLSSKVANDTPLLYTKTKQ